MESDVFFQDEDADNLFGEWSNLLGIENEEVTPTPIDPSTGGIFPSTHPNLPSNYDDGNTGEDQMYPKKRFCSIM